MKMSIMNAFRGIIGTQPQTPPSVVANPTVPSTATPTNDGTQPTPVAIPTAGKGDASPIDKYAELWNKDGIKPTVSPVPTFNADPDKLAEAAKNFDFTKAVDPALITKALAGDATAFTGAINQAVQAGFAQSAGTTTQLIERALTDLNNKYETEIIPGVLRRHEISQELRSTENSIFSDPATQPLVAGLETQLAAKYPQSSPTEIRTMATEYLDGVFKKHSAGRFEVTDVATQKPGSKVRKDTDWEDLLAAPSS